MIAKSRTAQSFHQTRSTKTFVSKTILKQVLRTQWPKTRSAASHRRHHKTSLTKARDPCCRAFCPPPPSLQWPRPRPPGRGGAGSRARRGGLWRGRAAGAGAGARRGARAPGVEPPAAGRDRRPSNQDAVLRSGSFRDALRGFRDICRLVPAAALDAVAILGPPCAAAPTWLACVAGAPALGLRPAGCRPRPQFGIPLSLGWCVLQPGCPCGQQAIQFVL